MFMWLKIELAQNAEYQSNLAQGVKDPEVVWARSFWIQMIEEKVVFDAYCCQFILTMAP